MPFLPTSISNLNDKVNSARKGFNSTLDKAGEKSGVPLFKNKSAASTTNSSLAPTPPQVPQRSALGPPPPPPRRIGAAPARATSSSSLDQSYGPPPSVSKKPSLANNFSTNRHTLNVHSEPSQRPEEPIKPPIFSSTCPPIGTPIRPPPPMTTHATSSTYGPPSPPSSSRDISSDSNPTHAHRQPPEAPSPPPRSTYSQPGLQKHSAIPFPPFSQFTESDKLAFFELLDDFFACRVPPQHSPESSDSEEAPPPILLHSRPPPVNADSKTHGMTNFQATYPTSCSGAILAVYFSNYRQWSPDTDHWYTSPDPVPTPIQSSTDVKRMSSWSQTGNTRTQINYVLFADLSQAWSTLTFNVSRPFPPHSADCRYLPTPASPDTAQLVACAENYGPLLVRFAEQAEQSGRHVARGECWDLANEALKAVPSLAPHLPPPLTSISRTHGYLLYHGKSNGLGVGEGEWVAQDIGQVRPGDLIEWNLAACDTVNPRMMCTLGDPDHTAIIVAAHGSTISKHSPAPPSQLGHITVVEQSLKQLPVRRTYDLGTISRGSVWIYRPASVVDLLGESRDSCDWPPKCYTYQA